MITILQSFIDASLVKFTQNSLYYVAGPVMSKFTTAFRELGTYKELLRSQVLPIMYHWPLPFLVVYFTSEELI